MFLLFLFPSFCMVPSSCSLLWPLSCFYDQTPFSFRNVFRIRFVLVQEVSILLHSRLRLDGSRPNRAATLPILCALSTSDEIKSYASHNSTKFSTCTERNRKDMMFSSVYSQGEGKKFVYILRCLESVNLKEAKIRLWCSRYSH